MNIESANLPSLAAGSVVVDSMSPPSADGSVVAEGFSGALVAQIGLLSTVKGGDSLPLQSPDVTGLQSAVADLPATTVDAQDFAALLGNDLPTAYKINDDVDYKAALAAVTDTLKYITQGTTAGEKAAMVEQNMRNVTAMAVPSVEPGVKAVIAMADPSMKAVIAPAVPAESSTKDVVETAVPADPLMKEVIATPVLTGPNMKAVIAMAVPAESNMKDAVVTSVSAESNVKDAAAKAVSAESGVKGAVAKAVSAESNVKDAAAKAVSAESSVKDVVAKAVSAESSVKDVIAKAVPAEQSMKDVIAMTVPAEQSMKDVIAMTVPAEQSMKDVIAMVVPVEQSMKNVVAAAIPVKKSPADAPAEAEPYVRNVIMDAPVQIALELGNDKPDKTPVEGDAQIAVNENNSEVQDLLAVAIMPPPVMQVDSIKTANNLTPAGVIDDGASPSFTKLLAGDTGSNQSAKTPDNVLQSEAIFRQPVQDKQAINLNSFESLAQTEKTGRVEPQVLSLEGEKTLPRLGADMTQLNRPAFDNKADVPAMTKPLSHPEWNKDMGDRIVWMSNRAIPSAEIRLNPPNLGPISVRVDVSDDQATVVFTAQHAAVRETLEASIPKLREMMSAQQLNLAEVNISQGSVSEQGRSQAQNFAQTADGRGQRQGAPAVAIDEIDEVEQEIASGRATVSKGLLSIYA